MAKGRKTVLKGFDYRHCDDFAGYLNEMAAKGWHFKEWGAGLIFEKGEPEAAVYAVEVFIDGSEYDTRPEPNTKEFAEYCEVAGWKLVDAKRKFCIFKRIREDALPILTDAERLDNIVKAEKGGIWSTVIIGAVYSAMRWSEYAMAFERYIFSSSHVLITAIWSLLLLMALLRCGGFYLWQHRCRKLLAQGEGIVFGKGKHFYAMYSWITNFILLCQLIALILLEQTSVAITCVVIIGAFLVMGFLIAKFRPDALTNQIIQLVVSIVIVFGSMCCTVILMLQESDTEKITPVIPLTYAHIGMELQEPELNHWDTLDGFFGNWVYYNLDYGDDYLYYHVYESKYSWVLERVWESETDGKVNEIRDDCTGEWGAELAFRNNAGDYLVRYEDRILVFCGSVEAPLSPEQIGIIREKLELR